MMDYVSLIKDRLSVSEVISTRVRLHNKSGVMWGLCPFHNEKTPSFKVDDKRGTYYCFGCGKHGDMFSFIQEFDNCSFVVALDFLAKMANVDISSNDNSNKCPQKATISSILSAANKFFIDELFRSKEALNYIKQRIENLGFDFKMVCELYGIGFAPDNNVIINKLKEKYTVTMLKNAGLLNRNEFPLFKNRIIFPIKDSKANIVAFGGRLLPSVRDKPIIRDVKYINSPETEIFHKSKVFYGFSQLLNMRQFCAHVTEDNLYNSVVIVEGYIDTITLQMAGVKALGVLGTSFTPFHINILKRFKKIKLCFDGDNAGLNAFKRSIQTIFHHDIDFISRVQIVFLPDGKDPYDMYIEDKNLFSKLLKESFSVSDAIWEFYTKREDIKTNISSFSPEKHLDFLSLIEKDFLSFIDKKDNANAYFALKRFFGRKLFATSRKSKKESQNIKSVFAEYDFASSKNKNKDILYKSLLLQLSVMYPEILLECNRYEKISGIQFHDNANSIIAKLLISFIDGLKSQNGYQSFVSYIKQQLQNNQINSGDIQAAKKLFAPLMVGDCTEDAIVNIISNTTGSFLQYNSLTKEDAAKSFDKHYKAEMLSKKHENLKKGGSDPEKISEFFNQIEQTKKHQ